MFHDGPAPYWLGVMDAAQAWGIPPWTLAQRHSPMWWFIRRNEYLSLVNKKQGNG